MTLRVLDDSDLVHVLLSGRLDLEGVSAVEVKFLALTAARRKSTIVDLSEVTFLGSLGIGMLVTTAKALARCGVAMVLLDPQAFVERTLTAANITEIIPIARGVDQAREILAGRI